MNPLRKLTQPPYPNTAIGLTAEGASLVALDKRRDVFRLQQAGYIAFAEGAVLPGFDEPNLIAPEELAGALRELAASVGLERQQSWSATLPEATMRSTIVTMEGAPASGGEIEEMLGWKIERAFHHPLAELRVARRRLAADERGHARYLVSGVRLAVLNEYEEIFRQLGWQAGLILPRHIGEAWWLMRDGQAGDALLVSSHEEGFTAVITHDGEPVVMRHIACEADECTDELYRLLLFYRDRLGAPRIEKTTDAADAPREAAHPDATSADATYARSIERVLLVGDRIGADEGRDLIGDTLGVTPRLLRPEDFALSIPAGELRFEHIAAPAALAALAY